MKITAEPRSDQWNADDFLGGARTFTIAGVKEGTAEQKYDIALEGETRAWRPPLGMLRVLMQAWGDESEAWVGRRVTLYRDQTVRFGSDVLGGIRISHLSHIEGPKNYKVTTTRGKRATYTVQPLPDAPKQAPQPAQGGIPEKVQADTAKAIQDGTVDSYLTYLADNGAPDHIINYVTETAAKEQNA
jgi:hypothetical protein